MSISVSNLTSGGSAGNVSVYTTYDNSISPTANSVMIAVVEYSKTAGVTDTVAVTGFGSNWTSLSDITLGTANSRRLNVLYASIGASPSADSVRFTFASAQSGCGWILDNLTGSRLNLSPVVQSSTSTSVSVVTQTVTLANAFASANNGTYVAHARSGAQPGTLQNSLLIQSAQTRVGGTAGLAYLSAWSSANVSSSSVTWNNANDTGSMIFEIAVPATVLASPYYLHYRRAVS